MAPPEEDPLQAVVVCDAWDIQSRWGPLLGGNNNGGESWDESSGAEETGLPWCLLPLLNVPLLAWTIESLDNAGVEEAHLIVNYGIEQVKAYVAESLVCRRAQLTMKIFVHATTAVCPGDVMREIDSRGILSPQPYVFVRAGYVGNVNITKHIDNFKKRRAADPHLTMAALMVTSERRLNNKWDACVLDTTTDTPGTYPLLHLQELELRPRANRITIPRELVGEGRTLSLRTDLAPTGVLICSMEVAPLFSENFDYLNFFPDFVSGILSSDLLTNTMDCVIIDQRTKPTACIGRRVGEWAMLVETTSAYDIASRALLGRRSLPLVPEEPLWPDEETSYNQRRNNVYISTANVTIAKGAQVHAASLVGTRVNLQPGAQITESVLGHGVSVGRGAQIRGCYIFDDCTIGDNCILVNSILGRNVVVGSNSVLVGGSFVGADSVIGTQARLSGVSLAAEPWQGGPLGQSSHIQTLENVGEDKNAHLWPREEPLDEDEEEDLPGAVKHAAIRERNLASTRLGLLYDYVSEDDASSDSDSQGSSFGDGADSDGVGAQSSSADDSASFDADSDQYESLANSFQHQFDKECQQSVDRALAEGHSVENAAIELKTLRMASNVPQPRVRDVVLDFLLSKCYSLDSSGAQVHAFFGKWASLVSHITSDDTSAAVDVLLGIQRFAADVHADRRFYLLTLKEFYEQDVTLDDAILEWYQDPRSRASEALKEYWGIARVFVQAINEADSGDEEDE